MIAFRFTQEFENNNLSVSVCVVLVVRDTENVGHWRCTDERQSPFTYLVSSVLLVVQNSASKNCLFLLNLRETMIGNKQNPIRFGDLYHSANRTPSSDESETWCDQTISRWYLHSFNGVR